MKNFRIQIIALIVGVVCFSCSSDKCENGKHDKKDRSHHEKGGKDHFGKGRGFHTMNPDSMAKHRTEKMKEKLSLSEEQLPKVEQMNLKYAIKMKELRDQMKKLEEERNAELNAILTKEQIEKLKKGRGRRSHGEPADSSDNN